MVIGDRGPMATSVLHADVGRVGRPHRAQKLDKLGMRGSDTCELIFEDCEV